MNSVPILAPVASQKQMQAGKNFADRIPVVAFVFAVLICLTRLPLMPGQLFSFDEVNFAYSLGDFDISRSQPQPPGYPVYVLEMRMLELLRFKRPESILLALQVIGSVASCVATFSVGRAMFGTLCGWLAALLLAVHPAFWFAGLTSGVRIQLALVSALVAGSCCQAWKGNARAATVSGLLLGIGAGARPEIGPLLVPLWAVGVWRAERSWAGRLKQGLILLVCVLVWLVPLVIDSGGPAETLNLTWGYFQTQAAGLTSGLFGAETHVWARTLVWLILWTLCGVLALTLPAVLAWRRGFGIGWERSVFLWVWFLPAFLFAAGVHVGDPGHVLGMLPPVCLVSAHLMKLAADRLRSQTPLVVLPLVGAFPGLLVWLGYTARPEMIPWTIALGGAAVGLALRMTWQMEWATARVALKVSRFLVPLLAVLAPLVVWLGYTTRPEMIPWTIALAGSATGILIGFSLREHSNWLPPWQALLLVMAPAAALSLQIFLQSNWYYAADDRSDTITRIRRDVHSAFRQMSYELVRDITNEDDHHIRDIQALAQERPGSAVAVWDRGTTDWRKLSYYAPGLPIVIIGNEAPRMAMGPDVQRHMKEIQLPSRPRLILLTREVPAGFANIERRGVQIYVDPPSEQTEWTVGDVRLHW